MDCSAMNSNIFLGVPETCPRLRPAESSPRGRIRSASALSRQSGGFCAAIIAPGIRETAQANRIVRGHPDGHARRDDLDLVWRELAKMGDQIFFDVMAARLKVAGVACTEAVGDLSAQPPRPAEELRMMNLLDVWHAQNRRLAAG